MPPDPTDNTGNPLRPGPAPLHPGRDARPLHLAPAPLRPGSQPPAPSWRLPLILIFLTYLSTTLVGAAQNGVNFLETWDFAAGAPFAVPLMSILLAHEFGHYLAARRHRVPASPPYFIPMPIFLLGTMGAVIVMRGRIRSRDALLDIGAAGPLAGLAVALPVLVYGIAESPIAPSPANAPYLLEGRSLLYLALLHLIHGPFPDGHDIMLTPTALAGWAGLLITMINLIPVGQLDGGHIAYALFGRKQQTYSKRVRSLLLFFGVAVSLYYGLDALTAGKRGDALVVSFMAGMQWFIWWLLLTLIARRSRVEHPDTDPGPLSPRRRRVAAFTLLVFVLLFMPYWIREVIP
jgi:membrane-associated protease RseP (regulator of RpoE activity)